MEKPSFVYVTYIATTPEKLWAALISPEFTKQYWGGWSFESDWKAGSPVRFINPHGREDRVGEVLEVRPQELLSYTWRAEPPSRVTFRLEPFGTTTRLTVTHEGLVPDSREFKSTQQGWFAILSSLKSLLETGKPLPYPWKGHQ